MATWRRSWRSVQVKSRPATSGVPCVRSSPGDTTLTCRLAGVRPSSATPSTAIAELLRSLPSGSRVANATDVTPGNAASRSTTSCCIRVTRSGSATVAAGIVRLNVCRRPGSVNPGSTRRKRLEAADHQPGADQQHQRQRELRRDQDLLRSLLLAAEAGAAPAVGHVVEPGPQRAAAIGSSPKTRPEASAIASAKPSATGSTAISWSRGSLPVRSRPARARPAAASRTPSRPPASDSIRLSTRSWPVNPRPARAQGGADGQLLTAALGPHQQQVGDVGAGQQQDDADRAQEHPERAADVADDVADQRLQRRRPPRPHLGPGPGALEPYLEHAHHVGIGLRRSDAGTQPGHAEQPERRNRRTGIEPQRQDDLGLAGEAEAGRHHADDLPRAAVDDDRALDDGRDRRRTGAASSRGRASRRPARPARPRRRKTTARSPGRRRAWTGRPGSPSATAPVRGRPGR